MLKLDLGKTSTGSLKVLCLGAHSDDIEIGCGGTVLRLIQDYRDVDFYWVVFSATGQRAEEAAESAEAFLQETKSRTIILNKFRDGFFPFVGSEIKEHFEQIKCIFEPDLILTHHSGDLHQDHRLISEMTWQTFRNHLVLEYEIPKYDADLGSPNFFVHLSETLCQRKLSTLLGIFKSQNSRHWFTADTFMSILRIRGLESNAPEKLAEAFQCRKAIY